MQATIKLNASHLAITSIRFGTPSLARLARHHDSILPVSFVGRLKGQFATQPIDFVKARIVQQSR